MKKFLMAGAALLSFAAAAQAADLPRKSVAPVAYLPPAFTWTGFYAGVNAGAAINAGGNRNGFRPGGNFLNPALSPAANTPFLFGLGNNDETGFQAGGQIGYNWQFNQNFVLGVEADIQYRDTGGRNNNGAVVLPSAVPFGSNLAFGGRSGGDNYYGTVRGRVGYAFDRALVYATGGFAYGGAQNNQSAVFTNAAGLQTAFGGARNDDTNFGYAIGGGVEYAFTNNISAKAEYLYVDLSDNKNRFAVSASPAAAGYFFNSRGEDTFHVVRAGLNYKFW